MPNIINIPLYFTGITISLSIGNGFCSSVVEHWSSNTENVGLVPSRKACIFRNWSRFGSYNVYLNDIRISYTQHWFSSIDNKCKCQILLLIYPYMRYIYIGIPYFKNISCEVYIACRNSCVLGREHAQSTWLFPQANWSMGHWYK